jgi:hypothetical protein
LAEYFAVLGLEALGEESSQLLVVEGDLVHHAVEEGAYHFLELLSEGGRTLWIVVYSNLFSSSLSKTTQW